MPTKRVSLLGIVLLTILATDVNGQVVVQGDELTIQSGAIMTIQDSLTVEQNGILNHSGKLILEGTLQMDTGTQLNGQGNICFIGSNARLKMNGIPLPNLEIANNDSLLLDDAITISDSLILSSGFLILGAHDLTLDSSTVISGGSDSSYIRVNSSGRVLATVGVDELRIPIGRNPYLPVLISNGGGVMYTVGVRQLVYQNPEKDSNNLTTDVVSETWTIQAAQPQSNVHVSVGWNADQEESGFDRNNSYLSSWESGVSTQWNANSTSSASGSGPYFQSGQISFTNNPFYLGVGSTNSALPVELISFNGYWLDPMRSVKLEWQTASEINNSHFLIQRSFDGLHFDDVGRVMGMGSTSRITSYLFTDTEVEAGLKEYQRNQSTGSMTNRVYYRLKQVDFDGQTDFSQVIVLQHATLANTIVYVYPNPTHGKLHVVSEDTVNSIAVYNLSGQLVYQAPSNQSTWDLQALPHGIYTLHISTARKGMVIHRIVRN